jgi:cytochrome P450
VSGDSPIAAGGDWDRCRGALADRTLTSDPRLAGLRSSQPNNFLMMDGETHHRLRRLIAPFFTSRRLQTIEPRLRDRCRALLDAVLEDPVTDLVADLVEPLVLDAILTAMEVPAARRDRLTALAGEMLGLLEPEQTEAERTRATGAAMRATMLFQRDRLSGSASGLHATLETAAEEGRIAPKLACSTPVVVLHGGYENPLNQLGCVVAWAVENPERFAALASGAAPLLFEEILRVCSPVRMVVRWAIADAEADPPRRRGDLVCINLERANHDSARFEAATEVDPRRRRRHLGFGQGAHACVGMALARLEGRVLIAALAAMRSDQLRRFEVDWREGVVARGPQRIVRRDP